MLVTRVFLLIGVASFFLSGCGKEPVPEATISKPYRVEFSDAQLISQLRDSWYKIEAGDDSKIPHYNELLSLFVKRARYDRLQAHDDALLKKTPLKVQRDFEPMVHWSDIYGDLIPCDEIKMQVGKTHNRYITEGIGVPVAGWVKKSMTDKLHQQLVIPDVGAIHTLTVYMSFPQKSMKDQLPTFHLALRMKKDFIKVGTRQVTLAADFSAPLSIIWQLSQIENAKFLGLFRPEKTVDFSGLSFVEPYDPTKIPVVFTHGLMSSPETFTNLINRLRVMPGIKENYQFWRYSYPTGVPWLRTTVSFLSAVNSALDHVDPQRKNTKLQEMVMVGHSMGGLITRLSISDHPWRVLLPFVKENKRNMLTQGSVANMMHKFSNTPSPDALSSPFKPVKRAIFLATPHRGAPFADNWIAQLGSYIVSLPKTLLTQMYKVMTLNEDMLNIAPDKLAQEMTSIRQLSPKALSIQGINLLQTQVPVHSVIGDQGKGNTPDSSDGIVPYNSSHLTWSKSEKIVPTDHSVQDSPECAKELYRILMFHIHQKTHSETVVR